MEQGNILEARNITKVYPGGVVANHNVNLSVKKGEIHALVGENGAGKSTLMKMLFGMLAPTEGQIFVDGKEVHFTSSGDAIAAGLGMVHQHFMQVPSMTVAENLILGAETGSPFKVDRKKAVEITRELSERYNLKVEAEEKVEDISLAMRQKLEILKALYRGAHILILDEPTNDLDIITLNVLEEYLKGFKGCLLIVSHDRFFTDKVVDRIFAFEGNGIVKDFPGNYTVYKNKKEEEKEQLEKIEKEKKKTEQPQSTPNNSVEKKRKLSFKERQEMQQLETDMEQLNTEKTIIETALNSGNLSPEELVAQSNRIAEIIAILDEKEMRWLELSEI